MKNKILISIFISFVSLSLFGQSVEITGSYGYQFGTRVDYPFGYVKAEANPQWGISAGIEVLPKLVTKLSYVSMNTALRGRDIDFTNNRELRIADLQNDWFLFGVQRYFQDGKIKPFAGTGLGFVVVSPQNINRTQFTNLDLEQRTFFAFNVEAGINYMFSESIGFNLQGNLYFPVNYSGFYIGTGGAGLTTGATQIIGSFSGGLVVKL